MLVSLTMFLSVRHVGESNPVPFCVAAVCW